MFRKAISKRLDGKTVQPSHHSPPIADQPIKEAPPAIKAITGIQTLGSPALLGPIGRTMGRSDN